MFYIIGLGLGDKEDITVKGYTAIKKCDYVYLEHYTAILSYTSINELEEFYGLPKNSIILADRELVEQKSDEILDRAKDKSTNVAFLVVGDPFCATTHADLFLRAFRDENIECKVIHNASIMNAIGCCGLQMYKFGNTVSIPFWTDVWKPKSFYEKIGKNIKNGLHTLCLLDIKVKEVSEENMIKGIDDVFEPPHFMTINIAIWQLMQIEKEQKQNICTEDTKCVGLARVGHGTQVIKYGKMKDLLSYDFGDPLHCLVIPSETHDIEDEMLDLFKIAEKSENIEKNESETESKEDQAPQASDTQISAPETKAKPQVRSKPAPQFQYANDTQKRLQQQWIERKLRDAQLP